MRLGFSPGGRFRGFSVGLGGGLFLAILGFFIWLMIVVVALPFVLSYEVWRRRWSSAAKTMSWLAIWGITAASIIAGVYKHNHDLHHQPYSNLQGNTDWTPGVDPAHNWPVGSNAQEMCAAHGGVISVVATGGGIVLPSGSGVNCKDGTGQFITVN